MTLDQRACKRDRYLTRLAAPILLTGAQHKMEFTPKAEAIVRQGFRTLACGAQWPELIGQRLQ
ncbi:hypothetical protein RGCCGE502_20250 [Rhizobium grahamii CCGE 502]|uniref:Uncharacterized protein n=1 Tax=Rhizobium grahamii CCGE 502 TaxID=990285 RepID=S3HTI0_9HYPH|nr:hypothetical protein RGCCGE502_20250 [Rhizobium grahamii CCGE 502]